MYVSTQLHGVSFMGNSIDIINELKKTFTFLSKIFISKNQRMIYNFRVVSRRNNQTHQIYASNSILRFMVILHNNDTW